MKEEYKALLDRQVELTKKKEKLDTKKNELTTELMDAMKNDDSEEQTRIVNQIEKIDKIIENNRKEYKENWEILEIYSKIVKTHGDNRNENLKTGAALLSVFGGLGLGLISLKGAFASDVNGSMVNKRTLDFFNKITNPLLKFFKW